MLAIDLQNAFTTAWADNFTCKLVRLIAKADASNRAKLALGYPVEVEAVEIYTTECPYKDEDGERVVDWNAIVAMASSDDHEVP